MADNVYNIICKIGSITLYLVNTDFVCFNIEKTVLITIILPKIQIIKRNRKKVIPTGDCINGTTTSVTELM